VNAPLDVAAIRARAAAATTECAEGSGAMRVLEHNVPNLCDALERERKASAAWKALAKAPAWPPGYESNIAHRKALDDLYALGIDPEAP
jgi:hypothetical protein